jgi:hypothetical protein
MENIYNISHRSSCRIVVVLFATAIIDKEARTCRHRLLLPEETKWTRTRSAGGGREL